MTKKSILMLLVFVLAGSGCNLPGPSGENTAAFTPSPTISTVPPIPTNSPTHESAQVVCVDQPCMDGMAFNYLIVTRPLFIEALTPFINWKTAQGFQVGLVTVEWLDANFEGRHMAERMKTGMHGLRKTAGVVYVLLVGDTSIPDEQFSVEHVLASYDLFLPWNVPTGFYRRLETDPPQDIIPSDAYFVEDLDWDPQNTGLNPLGNQKVGEGTIDASLYIGRWSVQTPEQIEPIFNKTRSVVPAMRVFFSADSTLTDGNVTYCQSGFPVPPGQEFFCYLDLMVQARRNLFEANTPWLMTEAQFTDINDSTQVQAFKEKFFNYDGIVFFSYHGNHDCWALDGAGCTGMAGMKFETVFPLLVTQSCLVSTFYFESSPSLSELLLENPTGPAVVAEPPNPYMFAQYLLEGKSIGEALWRSASTYVYLPNPISLFGDPSLIVLQPQP